MDQTREENQSLWLLTASPAIWAAHFLLSYVTVSIWCTKLSGPDGSLGMARTAIVVYTILALGGIGITGWIGYRRHGHGHGTLPHDDDTPEDRHRFLGYATFLLSLLSAVATTYSALVVIFFRSCN